MRIVSKGKRYGMPQFEDAIYEGEIKDCVVEERMGNFGKKQYYLIPQIEIEVDGRIVLYNDGVLYEGSELAQEFLSAADVDEYGCKDVDSLIGKTCYVELKSTTSKKGKEYIAIQRISYDELDDEDEPYEEDEE